MREGLWPRRLCWVVHSLRQCDHTHTHRDRPPSAPPPPRARRVPNCKMQKKIQTFYFLGIYAYNTPRSRDGEAVWRQAALVDNRTVGRRFLSGQCQYKAPESGAQ